MVFVGLLLPVHGHLSSLLDSGAELDFSGLLGFRVLAEGRQGKGGRTFLASPLTAAAAAVTGTITDARTLGGRG